MKDEKWTNRFLELAEHVASWSKDTSTKVGAILVNENKHILSIGYNGFPRNVDDNIENRYERPEKYLYTEHAERNAIYNAAYNNTDIRNSTCYVTLFPCADCARAIIQSGVKKVVCKKENFNERYEESNKVAIEMFNEANVEIQLV